MHSDPLADYLTRLRNAGLAEQETCLVTYSKIKEELSKILKACDYLADYEVKKNERDQKELLLHLLPERTLNLKRVSKPGRRIYCKAKQLPKVLNGFGIAILSTPQGLMSNKEAAKQNLGGEVICEIY